MLQTKVDAYEAGNTLQFTWVGSVAPDAAPRFSVTDPTGTVTASFTAVQSATTAYYALFTNPTSPLGYFLAEWKAVKTVNGSAYNFITRQRFMVAQTEVVP
jgi:hypothetical protein